MINLLYFYILILLFWLDLYCWKQDRDGSICPLCKRDFKILWSNSISIFGFESKDRSFMVEGLQHSQTILICILAWKDIICIIHFSHVEWWKIFESVDSLMIQLQSCKSWCKTILRTWMTDLRHCGNGCLMTMQRSCIALTILVSYVLLRYGCKYNLMREILF